MTNALAMLRLLPMSDHAKDMEILALRHQITVLQCPASRTWLRNRWLRIEHGRSWVGV
jgi:hypothetical protein